MKSLRSLLLFFLCMQLFGPVCAMVTKLTLKQIEADIRMLETNAIAELKKAFPLISESEWAETFKDIEKCKADLKIHLAQKDAAITMPSVYPANTPFVYEKFEEYTKRCTVARGINPEKIGILIESSNGWSPVQSASAWAITNYEYRQTLTNNTWRIIGGTNFRPMVGFDTKQNWDKYIHNQTIWMDYVKKFSFPAEYKEFKNITDQIKLELKTFKKDLKDFIFPKHARPAAPLFHKQFIEHTIHHEITHIIEGHGITTQHVKMLIEKYYGKTTNNNPSWFAFTKTHEYMAELMPSLLFNDIAQYAYKLAKFRTNPPSWIVLHEKERFSKTHATDAELLPWLQRIVQAHSQS